MCKILLVDDSATVLFKMRRDIEQLGHEVTTASTLEVALARVRTSAPDLVLLDLEMHPHDGVEIGRALLTQDRTLGIIIHSGKEIPVLLKAANELAAVGIVRKGRSIERLEAIIDRSLQFRHQGQTVVAELERTG